MKNIAKSLAKFHELMGNVEKSANNPFFKSKYAPLEAILPAIKKPLAEAGLVFSQCPTNLTEQGIVIPALLTTLADVESGEFLTATVPLILAKQDPQGVGSAITYMRRYALVSILGLNCDVDDDGQASVAKVSTKSLVAPLKANGSSFTSAKSAISKADTLETLIEVKEQINKSKLLTSDEKKELTEILVNKTQSFDPL